MERGENSDRTANRRAIVPSTAGVAFRRGSERGEGVDVSSRVYPYRSFVLL